MHSSIMKALVCALALSSLNALAHKSNDNNRLPMGHLSRAGAIPEESELQKKAIKAFLSKLKN
ncbi:MULTISPECIES: hypothetical protein [Polynucleobacter]|uniref:hypothetical protein n=1 Tax=Polynucleobacter TaxID=44013 RepID=UPI0011A88DC1|nr:MULTISPECIES: hypothetical protein [Polynucleobacter]MBU3551747.1 hypothetical protein [Polynucleobacter sp. MWH-Post4-6-1]MBU3610716.1 hypothetical protein [Polynucleobacter wuianus]